MLALQKMKTPISFEIKAADEEMEKVGNSETTVVEVMAGRKEARKVEEALPITKNRATSVESRVTLLKIVEELQNFNLF